MEKRRKEMEEKLMNVKEVAEFLNVSEVVVYRWAKQGFIPCLKVGRQYRFIREEVIDWARKRGSKGRIRQEKVNQYT